MHTKNTKNFSAIQIVLMENKAFTIEKERLIVLIVIALKNCEKYFAFRNKYL